MPGPCDERFGLSALRSLTSWARRTALETFEIVGAFNITRGDKAAHCGHAQGSA